MHLLKSICARALSQLPGRSQSPRLTQPAAIPRLAQNPLGCMSLQSLPPFFGPANVGKNLRGSSGITTFRLWAHVCQHRRDFGTLWDASTRVAPRWRASTALFTKIQLETPESRCYRCGYASPEKYLCSGPLAASWQVPKPSAYSARCHPKIGPKSPWMHVASVPSSLFWPCKCREDPPRQFRHHHIPSSGSCLPKPPRLWHALGRLDSCRTALESFPRHLSRKYS